MNDYFDFTYFLFVLDLVVFVISMIIMGVDGIIHHRIKWKLVLLMLVAIGVVWFDIYPVYTLIPGFWWFVGDCGGLCARNGSFGCDLRTVLVRIHIGTKMMFCYCTREVKT